MNLQTGADIARDLRAIGLGAGDMVMVHAAMRRVGPLIGGPDTLIGAIREVIGDAGTLAVATDWHAPYLEHRLTDAQGRVLPEWRDHIPPFDRASTRAVRDNSVIAEFLRTTPGALRSANPNCGIAAIGGRAAWLVADHPLDFGYGPGSPLAKLVEAGGRVLMIGAPLDTMTLLHHAEHLADVPDKRVLDMEIPHATPGGTHWRMTQEYESTEAIVAGLPDDYFATLLTDYLRAGHGRQGAIGQAPSILVDAAGIVAFATRWIETAVAERAVNPARAPQPDRGPELRTTPRPDPTA